MQIFKNKVAILNYTLKDDEGDIIDESQNGEFAYLHGAQNIIPGLEDAMEGKQAGDKVKVSVAPADAYGERDPSRIQVVPREMFEQGTDIQPGMEFHAQSQEGHMMIITVAKVDGDEVTIDGNHALAGKNLHFDVDVVSVRDATEEEVEHGHVHGPEGHHHH
jgi:FKBP-type peptidyl-prolyl cis-trans isomerase SlyD